MQTFIFVESRHKCSCANADMEDALSYSGTNQSRQAAIVQSISYSIRSLSWERWTVYCSTIMIVHAVVEYDIDHQMITVVVVINIGPPCQQLVPITPTRPVVRAACLPWLVVHCWYLHLLAHASHQSHLNNNIPCINQYSSPRD